MYIKRLDAAEPLPGLQGITVGDFWSWSYSDALSNTNRAVLAEFLVGTALCVTDVCRTAWDSVDLRYSGRSIEVKASAHIQSWFQSRPSKVVFSVRRPPQ